MKRILLAITILFSFIIVEAQVLFPYGEASGKAEDFYTLVEDYNTYFINMNQTNPSNKIPYAYTKNTIGINNDFTINGLVNNDEYILSTKGSKYDSYLYTGADYWTMGGSCINQYGLSVTCEGDNSIRLTEYVKKGIRITGSGTYIDPWTFRKTRFNVTFATYGGTLSRPITKISAIYDEVYSELEGLTALKAGYNFVCWTLVPNSETCILPTTRVTAIEDHVLFAKYEARTDTNYVVRHYLEKIGISNPGTTLSNYTLVLNEARQGTTDTTVAYNGTTYTGFTLVGQSSQTINGNGSTVVNYLYTRNRYTLTLTKDGNTSGVYGAGTYDYQENVGISCVPLNGRVFNYWQKLSGYDPGNFNAGINNQTIQMPASDVTIQANSKMSYTFAFIYTGGVYAPGFTQSGSTFTTENPNWYVKFTSSGTLNVLSSVSNVDIFVVGGGAGGNAGNVYWLNNRWYSKGGTGGGGGLYTTQRNLGFTFNSNYDVTIGGGGGGKWSHGHAGCTWNHNYDVTGYGGGGSWISGAGIYVGANGGSPASGGVGAWQTSWSQNDGGNSGWGWNGTYPFGDTLVETVVYGSTGGGGAAHDVTWPRARGGAGAWAGEGGTVGNSMSNCYASNGNPGHANTGGGGGGGGAMHINACNCITSAAGGAGGSGVVMLRNAR